MSIRLPRPRAAARPFHAYALSLLAILIAPLSVAATTDATPSLTWPQIQSLMKTDTGSPHDGDRVVYEGAHPVVVVEQVLPGFPYPTFEVDNIKNPTLVFKSGADITFYVVNTSQVAPHSFAITTAAPPYAVVPADHRVTHPLVDTGNLPILADPGHYSYAKVGWAADKPGAYYYVCLFPVHASFGMWGKIEVR